ncbi:MAG: tRNA lysidine(34) synthetase TilS [Treponema sp.]|nr:tRNA lysidine(34) synthetase TilS [Treponema sp.]
MSPGIFLAAVSGGADSMALLAALCAVTQKENIFCLHVEHGLRPAEESSGDAEFVRDFCREAGINCDVVSIPPGKIASLARRRGIGIEAAARFFRRRALFRQAARLGENVVILTAHTKDDMLETALMRVLRGAGPAGLAAMPVSRGSHPRRILRPLLSITRADVISYLQERKIPWREDSTNKDEKFLRNRVRRRLIPLLNESFPSWKTALSGMSQTQSLAAAFIGEEACLRIVWNLKKIQPQSSLSTDAENFFAQPQIIREEALFLAVDRLLAGRKSSVPVKRSVIRRFCSGAVSAADLGPARVSRKDGKIVLSAGKKGFSETGFSLLIKEPGLYNLKNINIEVLQNRERPSSAPEDGGFFAALPLVFRRSFKDDFLVRGGRKTEKRDLAKNLISAVDSFGTAAFIDSSGVLVERDEPQERSNQMFYFVMVKRG